MVYTTTARIRILLKGVTTTAMSDSDVTSFITKADDLINSKIGNRYTVPFGTTPPVIQGFSEDIASYYIMRTLFTRDSQNKNEWIEDFKAAIASLNAIRDGKQVVLDSSGNELARIEEEVSSNTKDFVPTFGEDDAEDQQVSGGKLDEISDERDADS